MTGVATTSSTTTTTKTKTKTSTTTETRLTRLTLYKNKDESSIGAVNVCNRFIVQVELLKI